MNYLNEACKIIEFSNLSKILEILPFQKKDIYFVGGVTRSILNDKLDNKDIDLVIPNLDEETIEKILNKYKSRYYSGYRSIAISENSFEYQINSFRKDVYSTGRHTKVAEAKTLEQDSKRRDFTFELVFT